MSKRGISRIASAFVVLLCILCLPLPALAVGNSPATHRAQVGKIAIEVDPRVELISVVFRLAGNPEYNNGTLRPYVKAIEKHFGDFDTHPVVKMAAELRHSRSMSCDGPMSLAVHIDSNYQLRQTTEEWPSTLDERWSRQETEEFLEKLRRFAAETKFHEFFAAQGPIYEQGIRPCESVMSQRKVVTRLPGVVFDRMLGADFGEWLSDFFGVENTGELRLVLGFVNGFSNYGPRFESGATSEKYAIIGMRPFDPDHNIIFMPGTIGTVAHEFCHSFTNPIVDKYMGQMQRAGEQLFATHGPVLRTRGYQNWDAVLYETAVRACVASFIRQSIVDPGYMDYYLQREVGHGFAWTEDTGNFLKKYESNRDKYPTFESFFPEFVKFLKDYTAEERLSVQAK